MAGNIKGITIEFNGDTTKLDKALRGIEKSTKDIDKELKQVDKALKFNPTNVELWRQKQELLTQKIGETTSKLDLLKQTQAKIDSGEIQVTEEEYRKLQRDIIETESKLSHFEGELKKIGNINLRATSEQFKELGDKLTSAGEAMRGLSMAGAAVAGSIGALAVKSGQWADDLNTMSKVYNINTTELQKYKAAADLVDVSVEDIAKSHVKLEKSMYSAKDGSGAMAEAFGELGVSVTNSDGSLRDSESVFQDVIASLGTMTNETERDAIAQKILGKSAANLNPLIEDQGETYKNVADTFAQYDLDFVDEETLAKAKQFNDSLDTMKAIGGAAIMQVGAQLSAYLAPALEKVVDWIGKFAKWVGNLDPRILAVVGAIGGMLAVVSPLLIILGKVAFAISSITGLMATAGVSFAAIAEPIGIAIAVIGALIAIGVLLYKNWDTIKAKAIEIKNNLITTWNNIKTSITNTINALKTALTNAWNNIKTTATTAWNAIRTTASTVWNAIKTAVTSPIESAKATISSIVGTIKSVLSNGWNSIKSTASSVWNGIKSAITSPIETAKSTLSGIINKIKGFFPLKIGKIINFKIPKISLTTSTKKVLGKEITYPTGFDVSWHKQGGIFTSPTLLTDPNGGIHGVGEAGAEAIIPLDRFWRQMDEIANSNGITINVYGSDNMSVKELADEVERRLIEAQKRRRMAWQ